MILNYLDLTKEVCLPWYIDLSRSYPEDNQLKQWNSAFEVCKVHPSSQVFTGDLDILRCRVLFLQYSITFLPKISHLRVETLCNKIDRMLNVGQFRQNYKTIALPICPQFFILMWKFFAIRLSPYNRVLVISKIWVVKVGVKFLFTKQLLTDTATDRWWNGVLISQGGCAPSEKTPGVSWAPEPPNSKPMFIFHSL